MKEFSLYVDEILQFYNQKLLEHKKEIERIEEAIKTFENMKRSENI